MSRNEKFQVFAGNNLRDVCGSIKDQLRQEVRARPENYILNVNESEYVEAVFENWRIEPVAIGFDQVSAEPREIQVSADQAPSRFDSRHGTTFTKTCLTYHLPCSGDLNLLRLQPSSRCLMWSYECFTQENDLCFEVWNWDDNAEQWERDADHIIGNIRQQFTNLLNDVSQFNQELRKHTEDVFRARKNELLERTKKLASLKVPIRKARVPETIAVPVPDVPKKVRVVMPEAPDRSYEPEPTMDSEIYGQILQVIYDMGRAMEKHPSTYVGKDEEALRDLLLMSLAPRFELDAGGETFNNTGKTDILIPHQGKNLFVAECLIWRGPKYFLKKIDQLLGNLTWRDSKASLVVFAKTRDITTVLEGVQQSAKEHTCFLRLHGKPDESWFDYRFHLPGDENREVWAAVHVFHYPEG